MGVTLTAKPFGQTGLEVSPLQLGTVKIGRTAKLPYPGSDGFQLPDDDAVLELLATAADLGINAIDTAPAYGVAEARLGKLLGSETGKLHIFTKTGETLEGGVSHYDFSADVTRDSVHRSLKRLGVGCLAGVALHCPADDLDSLINSPALETLSRLKETGDLTSIGASTTTLEGGLKAVALCDYVMVAYNAAYRDQEPVIAAAHEAGKAVVVKKGFNSGKSLPGDPKAAVENHIRAIFDQPGTNSLAIGTINPDHLRECAVAVGKAVQDRKRQGEAGTSNPT